MNIFKIFSAIFFLALISPGCKNDDPPCDYSNSEFQTLYQSLISSGYTDATSYDTEIHEYTFTLSENKEVCEIGYQSQPGIKSTPYIIEISDDQANSLIYSDSHVFSSNETSYVEPTSPIFLQAGISYTIRRIQTHWDGNIGNVIGRLARKDSMNFPYTNGIVTITGANFYQNGGPLVDMGIPYIDLIFK